MVIQFTDLDHAHEFEWNWRQEAAPHAIGAIKISFVASVDSIDNWDFNRFCKALSFLVCTFSPSNNQLYDNMFEKIVSETLSKYLGDYIQGMCVRKRIQLLMNPDFYLIETTSQMQVVMQDSNPSLQSFVWMSFHSIRMEFQYW